MKTLAQATSSHQTWLRSLDHDEAARLDRHMSRLDERQIRRISRVLAHARAGELAPRAKLKRLERSLEGWWDQSLARKLAVLESITTLEAMTAVVTEPSHLPGDHMPLRTDCELVRDDRSSSAGARSAVSRKRIG